MFYLDSKDKQLPLALVVYKFDKVPEHAVSVRPHSNSKTDKSYYRTEKSVKLNLASVLKKASPKEAVDSVFISKGGLLGATSAYIHLHSPLQPYSYSFETFLATQTVMASVMKA